jgi:hypothetical protein
MTMKTDPYASGKLVKGVHDRLVANIENYARDAGVETHWLWEPLADHCGPHEVEWVKRFAFHRSERVHGLCLTRASDDPKVEAHMAAIAGVLVRNFVRARIMTLGTVLDAIAAGSHPEATCLLIPNFFQSKEEGGAIAPWQVFALHDLLVRRVTMGLQTVIYVSDMAALESEYGSDFVRLIDNNYARCEI